MADQGTHHQGLHSRQSAPSQGGSSQQVRVTVQIFFCDDLEDLMKHYFHDFTAEGVEEPFRLYTGSWRTPTTVKYFGLSEDTLHSDSGFVLVKLQKPRLTVRTEGEPRLMPEAAREFSKIRVGDEESVK